MIVTHDQKLIPSCAVIPSWRCISHLQCFSVEGEGLDYLYIILHSFPPFLQNASWLVVHTLYVNPIGLRELQSKETKQQGGQQQGCGTLHG